MEKPIISIKRAYESPSAEDGYRVLVDRLWPRGVSKEAISIDLWAKDVAPSQELRKAFGHDPEKFGRFRTDYMEELDGSGYATDLADLLVDKEKVTLVYGAKDTQHNNAVVLREWLMARCRQARRDRCNHIPLRRGSGAP